MNDLEESYTVEVTNPQQFAKYKKDNEKLTIFLGSEKWISCKNPVPIRQ